MFTSSVYNFLHTYFNLIFKLFNITIPGTNVSFFSVGMGVIITYAIISFGQLFNNFSINIGSNSAAYHRGGNSKSISDNRYKVDNKKNISSNDKYKKGD